jgi:hypothetical protein
MPAELPVLALPSPISLPGKENSFLVNPWIRSPLPPINAGPDTLRQFNDGNQSIPQRRLLPLPAPALGSTGGTTVTNTVVTATASGSSSASTGLTTVTLNYVSPLLVSGAAATQALNVSSKSYQLISMKSNGACEIRIYGSAVAQATDFSRIAYDPLPAELGNNLVTDVVLDTAPYVWNWQNRVGANQDSPQASIAYLTVFNTGNLPQNIQIAFVVLPLESAS